MFDLLQLFCAPALFRDGEVRAATPPPVPTPAPARPAAKPPEAAPAATDPTTGASLLAAAEQVAHDTMDVAHGSAAPAQVKQALADVQETVRALRAALEPNALANEGGPQRCNELASKLREQVAALTACVTSSCDPAFGQSLQQRMSAGGPVDQRSADAFAARASAHPEELRAALVNTSTNHVDPQQVQKFNALLQGMSPPARQAADAALQRAGLSLEVADATRGSATGDGAAARVSMDVSLTRGRPISIQQPGDTSEDRSMDATVRGRVTVNAESLRGDVENLMRGIFKDKGGSAGHVDIRQGPPLQFVIPFTQPTPLPYPLDSLSGEMTVTPTADGKFQLHIGGHAGEALRNLPDCMADPNDTAVELRKQGCNVTAPIKDANGGYTYTIEPNLGDPGGCSTIFKSLHLPTSVSLTGDSRVDLQNLQVTSTNYSINNLGELVCDFEAQGHGALTQGVGNQASHLPLPETVSAHVEARIPRGGTDQPTVMDVRDGQVTLNVGRQDAAAAGHYLKDRGYGDINAQGHVTLGLSGHFDADHNAHTTGNVTVTGTDAHYHGDHGDVDVHGASAHVTADVDVQQTPEVIAQEHALRQLQERRSALVSERDDAAKQVQKKSQEISDTVGTFSRGSTDQRLLDEMDTVQARYNEASGKVRDIDTQITAAEAALATLKDKQKPNVTVAVHHADATVHDSVVSIGGKQITLTDAQIRDLDLAKLKLNSDGSRDLTGLHIELDVESGNLTIGDKRVWLSGLQLKDLGVEHLHQGADTSIDLGGVTGGVSLRAGGIVVGDQLVHLMEAQIKDLGLDSLERKADGSLDLHGLKLTFDAGAGMLKVGNKETSLTGAQVTALNLAMKVEASRSGTLDIKRIEGGTTIKGDVLSLGDKSAQLTADQLRELNVAGLRVGPDGAIDLKGLGGRVAIHDGNLTIGDKQVRLTDAQLIALGVVKTTAGGDVDASTGIRLAIQNLAREAVALSLNPKLLAGDAQAAAVVTAARNGDAPALTEALQRLRSSHPEVAAEIDALASKKDMVIQAAQAGVVLSGARVTQEDGVTTVTGGLRLSADGGNIRWQGGPHTSTTDGPRSVGTPASDTAARLIRQELKDNWDTLSKPGSDGLKDRIETLIHDFSRGDAAPSLRAAAALRDALKNGNPDRLIDALMTVRSEYPAFASRVDEILTRKVGDHSLRELQESQGRGRATDATRLSSGQTTVDSVRVNDGSATPQDIQFEFTSNEKNGSKSFKIKGGATLTLGQIAVLAENLPPDIPADQRQSVQATLRRMIEFQGRADGWNMAVRNLEVTIDGQGGATCDAEVVSTRTDGFTLPDPTDPLARHGELRLGNVGLTGRMSLATDAAGKLTRCDLTNARVTWDYGNNKEALADYLKKFLNTKMREANAQQEITGVKFNDDGTLELSVHNTKVAGTDTKVTIRADGRQLRLNDNTTFENPLWNLTVVAPLFVNGIARDKASQNVRGLRRDEDGSLAGDPQAMARVPGLTVSDPRTEGGRFGFGFNYSMPPGN